MSPAPAARALPFLLPALAVLTLVLVFPVATLVYTSFTDKTSFLPGEWVGAENYETLLKDNAFADALVNNLLLLLSIPVTLVVALVIAGGLQRGLRGTAAYETAIFLPVLPAVASVSAIFIYIFANDGPLNAALRGAGLDGFARAWLAEPSWAIWAILAVVVWKRIGFVTLLLTARLSSLDRSQFEAAAVDGAGWWRTYWRIAVPQTRGVLAFASVLGFIEVFSWTFAYVYILTRGGPNRATWTLEYYAYETQFRDQLMGLAAAVGVFLLLAALVVAVYRVLALSDARDERTA